MEIADHDLSTLTASNGPHIKGPQLTPGRAAAPEGYCRLSLPHSNDRRWAVPNVGYEPRIRQPSSVLPHLRQIGVVSERPCPALTVWEQGTAGNSKESAPHSRYRSLQNRLMITKSRQAIGGEANKNVDDAGGESGRGGIQAFAGSGGARLSGRAG